MNDHFVKENSYEGQVGYARIKGTENSSFDSVIFQVVRRGLLHRGALCQFQELGGQTTADRKWLTR